ILSQLVTKSVTVSAFAVPASRNTKSSLPLPPARRSTPAPPSSQSSPLLPPPMLSLPEPPMRTSLPAPPPRVSLPPRPISRSRPSPPASVLAPASLVVAAELSPKRARLALVKIGRAQSELQSPEHLVCRLLLE